jgi:hypothetical protein
VLAQIERARAGSGERKADGVSIFSYASPRAADPAATVPALGSPPASDRLDFLVAGLAGTPGAFGRPAPVPPMPWIEHPSRGFVAGTVVNASGMPLEGVRLRLVRRRLFGGSTHLVSDANGWFGTGNLKPGRYRIEIEGATDRQDRGRVELEVMPGRVARARLVR